MIVAAFSRRDIAGSGAAKELVEILGAQKRGCGAPECYSHDDLIIAGFDEDVIELEMVGEIPSPDAEAIIVLSRHSSEQAVKTLSVHHVGNPTDVTLGGEPRRLGISYPALSKALMIAYRDAMIELGLSEYHLTLEATHHGPTKPGKPMVFIEIGSTEVEWRDRRAQRAMALAVAMVLERGIQGCVRATGIGGPHYSERFTRMQFESEICFGHILSRHSLARGVDEEVLRQSVERSYPGPSQLIVAEKKSMKKEQRDLLERIASSYGVKVEW